MKKKDISPRLKLLIQIVSIIPFIFLLIWMIIPDLYESRTFKDRFFEREEKIECIGVVDSIYRQIMNHNILTLKTNSCVYEIHSSWENKFLVGDSIIKREGELFIEHYRGGKLIEILTVKF